MLIIFVDKNKQYDKWIKMVNSKVSLGVKGPVDGHFLKKIVVFFMLPYKLPIWTDPRAHFGWKPDS